ncbi:hypothetical protein [Deinococcus maricopensis]|uniref:Uncharacterized protein n=1 Tax=Deinococcus maricopensis (strain DSM 21211 / LMG 22137 / NRRL B-23946 / LB-34) TaxID=709986 RepID=E8U7M5_DEIML|nr:hypothetical protein [Deinococcus maricopensis]ADV67064.1 hypothetical protein Deima_1415 [Deinococcus maricopensis DSM 21211]
MPYRPTLHRALWTAAAGACLLAMFGVALWTYLIFNSGQAVPLPGIAAELLLTALLTGCNRALRRSVR